MTNSIFHNEKFEINGVSVPEFELKKGNLIRIYIPNFGSKYQVLGFELTIELIKHFQNKKTGFPWAKNYSQNSIEKLFRPLTAEKYLRNNMRIDTKNTKRIVNEIGINLTDKLEHLNFTNKKALIVKALFEKNDSIILDYYGVDAIGIKFLENIVNSEIEKGKSAIAFDRLEFKAENEPFENIKAIKITVPSALKPEDFYTELYDYIFEYGWMFSTEIEKKASNHHLAKVKFGRLASKSDKAKEMLERKQTSDPEALALLKNGYPNFIKETALRIYRDHKEELDLNFCPKCNKIARTPKAKQCRFCFHSWR